MILKKVNVEYSEDRKVLVRCPTEYKGVFTIPAGVEIIDLNAFKNCEGITGVNISNTVKTINTSAFMYCKNIEFVNFEEPCQVSYIGINAFYMCEKLEEFKVPELINEIADGLFYNCTYLKKVTLPKTVTTIGAVAFWCCCNLPEIILPPDLEEIKDSAFGGCSSLKAIIIPDKVKEIRANTFEHCSYLTKVLIGVDSQLSRIHTNAFYNCERLVSINIPDSIRRIDKHAFHNCDSLKSLYIPAGTRLLEDEIAAMSNMSFTFFCEGEPNYCWEEGWNCMGNHIAGNKLNSSANTMFNVPRWWYVRFGLPETISDNLLRTSSSKEDFDKEKVKSLISSTDKTLFFRTGWGWRGEGREEITKEAAIKWIDTATSDPSNKSYDVEVYEYETEILLNLFDQSLPF